jgi:hypothetical protein
MDIGLPALVDVSDAPKTVTRTQRGVSDLSAQGLGRGGPLPGGYDTDVPTFRIEQRDEGGVLEALRGRAVR